MPPPPQQAQQHLYPSAEKGEPPAGGGLRPLEKRGGGEAAGAGAEGGAGGPSEIVQDPALIQAEEQKPHTLDPALIVLRYPPRAAELARTLTGGGGGVGSKVSSSASASATAAVAPEQRQTPVHCLELRADGRTVTLKYPDGLIAVRYENVEVRGALERSADGEGRYRLQAFYESGGELALDWFDQPGPCVAYGPPPESNLVFHHMPASRENPARGKGYMAVEVPGAGGRKLRGGEKAARGAAGGSPAPSPLGSPRGGGGAAGGREKQKQGATPGRTGEQQPPQYTARAGLGPPRYDPGQSSRISDYWDLPLDGPATTPFAVEPPRQRVLSPHLGFALDPRQGLYLFFRFLPLGLRMQFHFGVRSTVERLFAVDDALWPFPPGGPSDDLSELWPNPGLGTAQASAELATLHALQLQRAGLDPRKSLATTTPAGTGLPRFPEPPRVGPPNALGSSVWATAALPAEIRQPSGSGPKRSERVASEWVRRERQSMRDLGTNVRAEQQQAAKASGLGPTRRGAPVSLCGSPPEGLARRMPPTPGWGENRALAVGPAADESAAAAPELKGRPGGGAGVVGTARRSCSASSQQTGRRTPLSQEAQTALEEMVSVGADEGDGEFLDESPPPGGRLMTRVLSTPHWDTLQKMRKDVIGVPAPVLSARGQGSQAGPGPAVYCRSGSARLTRSRSLSEVSFSAETRLVAAEIKEGQKAPASPQRDIAAPEPTPPGPELVNLMELQLSLQERQARRVERIEALMGEEGQLLVSNGAAAAARQDAGLDQADTARSISATVAGPPRPLSRQQTEHAATAGFRSPEVGSSAGVSKMRPARDLVADGPRRQTPLDVSEPNTREGRAVLGPSFRGKARSVVRRTRSQGRSSGDVLAEMRMQRADQNALAAELRRQNQVTSAGDQRWMPGR